MYSKSMLTCLPVGACVYHWVSAMNILIQCSASGSIIDLFTHLIFKFFRQNQNDSPNKNLISSYKHIRVLLRRRWINFNWAKKLIMSSNIVYKQFGSFFVYNANEKRTLDRKKLMTFSCALSFDTWTKAIAQHLSMWQFQLGWHKKIQIVR